MDNDAKGIDETEWFNDAKGIDETEMFNDTISIDEAVNYGFELLKGITRYLIIITLLSLVGIALVTIISIRYVSVLYL